MSKFKKSDRPHGYTDEIRDYLNDLRESGRTNMYGADQYLQKEMSISKNLARTHVSYWMKSFGKEEGWEQ